MKLGLSEYLGFKVEVKARGFGDDIKWQQTVTFPDNPSDFSLEAIWVILCSGFSAKAAREINDRLYPVLYSGGDVATIVRHPLKAKAIKYNWENRFEIFDRLKAAEDQIAFLETLPHIGPITKYHLAKNIGIDCAKPDIHLSRIADAVGETVDEICARLAKASGDRIATIDYVLWRASEQGIIKTREL